MQLDDTDREILRELSRDARATYSEISKVVGVSVGTVRNRIAALRESGSLHLRVWLDPQRAGVGLAATFLVRVRPDAVAGVVASLAALDETGYLATLAGDHDIMVDVFCRDVAHLNEVLHEEVQSIDGVASVTAYLVTDIKFESNLNIVGLLDEDAAGPRAEAHAAGAARRRLGSGHRLAAVPTQREHP